MFPKKATWSFPLIFHSVILLGTDWEDLVLALLQIYLQIILLRGTPAPVILFNTILVFWVMPAFIARVRQIIHVSTVVVTMTMTSLFVYVE